MKDVLELTNELLLQGRYIDLDWFKKELLKKVNNNLLVEIIIKKGIEEHNLIIKNNKVKLVKKFYIKPKHTKVMLCLSIPPFEEVALKTIL